MQKSNDYMVCKTLHTMTITSSLKQDHAPSAVRQCSCKLPMMQMWAFLPLLLVASLLHTLHSCLLLMLLLVLLLFLSCIHPLVISQQPPQLTLCILNPASKRGNHKAALQGHSTLQLCHMYCTSLPPGMKSIQLMGFTFIFSNGTCKYDACQSLTELE